MDILKGCDKLQEYIAHRNENTGLVQSVKEHSENTAELCREYAVPELKEFISHLLQNESMAPIAG